MCHSVVTLVCGVVSFTRRFPQVEIELLEPRVERFTPLFHSGWGSMGCGPALSLVDSLMVFCGGLK